MQRKINLLIADDEESIRQLFCRAFEENGYFTSSVKSESEVHNRLKEGKFDIMILDVNMPGVNDLRVLREVKAKYPGMEVIIVSGHYTTRLAQESLNLGAYDYLTKPVSLDDLLNAVERAAKIVKQKPEVKVPEMEVVNEGVTEMLGKSATIQSVLSLLDKIAPTSSNVLINGETGAGKELVARYIHNKSRRSSRKFISVNCPSLPDTLLESELFGHEAGAYTDASKLKHGLLEVADGGTLFLDEVADLSPALQAKLLRVVETKIFRRLGGNDEIKVDVRFLSATNKNLTEEIEGGLFREDLFYRLGVVSINMPPLRKHKEDVPVLVSHFIRMLNKQNGKKMRLSDRAMDKLISYGWPGNVRQLKNVVEQTYILCDTDVIEESDLPNLLNEKEAEQINREISAVQKELKEAITLSELEKQHIIKILGSTKGNQTQAAKLLGISRRTLYQKIKEFSIYK